MEGVRSLYASSLLPQLACGGVVLSMIVSMKWLGGLSLLVALSFLSVPQDGLARGERNHQSRENHSLRHHSFDRPAHSKAAPGIQRDKQGRIKRSAAARARFKRQQPCPSTGRAAGACSGYVIDHVVPLKRGGGDTPENMQWQTTEAAKRKDRIE